MIQFIVAENNSCRAIVFSHELKSIGLIHSDDYDQFLHFEKNKIVKFRKKQQEMYFLIMEINIVCWPPPTCCLLKLYEGVVCVVHRPCNLKSKQMEENVDRMPGFGSRFSPLAPLL